MRKVKIIEHRVNGRGHIVRLVKRGAAYDVLYNNNGYAWMYKAKAVNEEHARAVFELEAL